MANPEQQRHTPEAKGTGTEQAAAERLAEIARDQSEKAGEQLNESEAKQSAERARVEASREAIASEEFSRKEQKGASEPSEPVIVNEKARTTAYKQTMEHIQQEMSPPTRVFSKVIHNPVIERTSEVVGNTVARPNALLSGSLFALIIVLALYLLARYVGFALSGFETIAAFILGWALGIAFDFLRVMITGKR